MNPESPADRLSRFISEGRLIRNKWQSIDDQGRETACLLAAMVPACGDAGSARACPASVMPRWLAELTPWIDDAGSEAAWPGSVKRYADLAHKWHVLTPQNWHRAMIGALIAILREGEKHDNSQSCSTVLALLCREYSGELVLKEEYEAAASAEASWEAADVAAWAWAGVAARAARAAAGAAAQARWAAQAAAAGAAAAGAAAGAAADRSIEGVLDSIECEIVHCESVKS